MFCIYICIYKNIYLYIYTRIQNFSFFHRLFIITINYLLYTLLISNLAILELNYETLYLLRVSFGKNILWLLYFTFKYPYLYKLMLVGIKEAGSQQFDDSSELINYSPYKIDRVKVFYSTEGLLGIQIDYWSYKS